PRSLSKGKFTVMLNRILPALLGVAVLSMASLAEPSPGADSQAQFREAVKEIVKVPKSEDHSQVAIGEFPADPSISASAGPMIQSLVQAELKKHEIQVAKKAPVTIKGEYLPLEEEKGKTEDLQVRVIIRLSNNRGKSLCQTTVDINYKNNEQLAKL